MTAPFPKFYPPLARSDRPCVLDLSRSFSRAGRPNATGIDRVERAYWMELERRAADVWVIVKCGRDHALLDRAAAADLMRQLARPLPCSALLGRSNSTLPRKISRRMATGLLRRRATYCGDPSGLTALLRTRLKTGFDYFNVGHNNLDAAFLGRLRRAGARLRIQLHDMIPLDFPDLVRAETPERFRVQVTAALRHADQIICNSAHTARRVRVHAGGKLTPSDCVVAHLGVTVPRVIAPPPVNVPYFVCIGTIEPRKNHAFLFRVWQRLAAQAGSGPVPKLCLVGTRGWRNDAVFRFLDSSPLMGRHVVEYSQMADPEMFALLAGAQALLFPSHEEGFGLPALEARALGVEVICSPIPVFRELLQGDALFLPTDDPRRWADAIMARVGAGASANSIPARPVPSWEQHFAKVFGPDPVRRDQAAQGALTSVRTV